MATFPGISGMPGLPGMPSLPSLPSVSAPGAGVDETLGIGKSGGGDFAQMLSGALKKVDALQDDADIQARRVVTGEAEDLTDAVLASEKARMSMEFTVQVRNKIVEAYQEVWRMPI